MTTDELLSKYFMLLSKWNEKISLISSARDEAEFQAKHVDDALELIPFLTGARTLLDIGTGAGIPGIVIKIVRPEIEVTLLDATRKKVSFCEEAIRQLGLGRIKAICGRAEDPYIMKALGCFDIVVSRATWRLVDCIAKSTSYISHGKGSKILAMKGPAWKKELDEAQGLLEKQGQALIETHEYKLTSGEARCILAIGRK